jgi:hypothetical protein
MSSLELEEFDQLDELEQLRGQIGTLQRQLVRSKAKTADLIAAVHLAAKDAAIAVGRPTIPAATRDRRTKHAEVALLLLSDWHIGKQTSSYNSTVAQDRVTLLTKKVALIAEIERADHPVRECHVLLNGDFVENLNIFPGQAFEVDSTMFTQLFNAANAVEGMLRALLSVFEHVHVWLQRGNHGRIGRKGDNPRADNLDSVLYEIVRGRLHSSRMVWHPMESWFTIVEIGNYRALLVHGDQVKSFGGNTPAFGITRKVNAWATGVLPPFTDVYMGHFHQPLVLPIANGRGRTFLNPSLESDSEYAREFVAATGTPGQRFHFVEPEKGRVTSERVIWLD